ncbi:DNA utilization protein GntX [Enterobacterales bacterium CwR94]|nr:DNA utilization protein GntX [Enterobacterales bacterium CwR94]
MLPMPALCWLCQMPLRMAHHGLCSFCVRAIAPLRGCPRCGLPSRHPTHACGRCLRHPPHWQSMLAVSDYAPPLSLLVNRLKFNATTALTAPLARLILLRLLLTQTGELSPRPDCIMSVPLHHRRALLRGFNQADLLAKQLARWLNIRYAVNGLTRLRTGKPQHRLPAMVRRRNLRGAFRVDIGVKGAHIVLIDDVVTTGSTVGEISRILRAAGAASVQVWCLCRTL